MDAISRRLWLTGALAGIVDLGVARASHAATLASEERLVAGFDSVIFDAAGELSIEQSNREHLRVEAEPTASASSSAAPAATPRSASPAAWPMSRSTAAASRASRWPSA